MMSATNPRLGGGPTGRGVDLSGVCLAQNVLDDLIIEVQRSLEVHAAEGDGHNYGPRNAGIDRTAFRTEIGPVQLDEAPGHARKSGSVSALLA